MKRKQKTSMRTRTPGEFLRFYLALGAIHFKHEIFDQLIESCGLKDWPKIESWGLRERCGPVILLMFLFVLSYPNSIKKVICNSFGCLGCGIYQAFSYPFTGGGGNKHKSDPQIKRQSLKKDGSQKNKPDDDGYKSPRSVASEYITSPKYKF